MYFFVIKHTLSPLSGANSEDAACPDSFVGQFRRHFSRQIRLLIWNSGCISSSALRCRKSKFHLTNIALGYYML